MPYKNLNKTLKNHSLEIEDYSYEKTTYSQIKSEELDHQIVNYIKEHHLFLGHKVDLRALLKELKKEEKKINDDKLNQLILHVQNKIDHNYEILSDKFKGILEYVSKPYENRIEIIDSLDTFLERTSEPQGVFFLYLPFLNILNFFIDQKQIKVQNYSNDWNLRDQIGLKIYLDKKRKLIIPKNIKFVAIKISSEEIVYYKI